MQESSGFDISAVSEVLGLQNGWFVAVITLIFVAYLLLRGHIVSSRTVKTQVEVLKESLDNEQESRQLWQKSAVELLQTSDIERANSKHMLELMETILKIVTDLQAARVALEQDSNPKVEG